MGLRFAEPYALSLLLGIPLLIYLYLRSRQKKKRDIIKFSSLALIKRAQEGRKHAWRRDIGFYLTVLAIVFLILAVADPHLPLKKAKKGVNVVLAIDISGSMQATDYKPNRLEAAKKSAETLLDQLKANDYVGIVTFESGATTAAYLSPAKDLVKDKLKAIAPREGRTAIGDGLSLAIDMSVSIPNKKKIVILLSDGVNNAGVITPQEAVAFAKTNKVQVYTIGMGSEGKVVLGYDWFGNAQYAELDESTLKAIAANTGGTYFKSVDDDTLNHIYDSIAKDIKREKEDTSIKDVFVSLAGLTLIILFYLQHSKYRVLS
ncbi:aerotolerance regulator BatA [Candidatus Woesearchaeota archaeon CG11_big_fil_rev_8_21_14_0_20_43_8]|nr:MAG: aerotolerance regulator BatA [Candidatus Woesearchaeota archaeon CG11_big_fil_rev_8_21_14_0_20_43_8]